MDRNQDHAGLPLEPGGEGPEEVRYADGRVEHPHVNYERKDIRFGCILALIALAACIFLLVYFGAWQFFTSQRQVQEEIGQSPYPPVTAPSTALPAQPRLEELDRRPGVGKLDRQQRMRSMTPFEATVANEQLESQEELLHSYGTTEEQGFVHIPIDDAIKAVAGELPVDKQSAPGRDANGLMDAGQTNSGRMFRGPLP